MRALRSGKVHGGAGHEGGLTVIATVGIRIQINIVARMVHLQGSGAEEALVLVRTINLRVTVTNILHVAHLIHPPADHAVGLGEGTLTVREALIPKGLSTVVEDL